MSDLFIVPKPQNMEVREEKLVFGGVDLQADDLAILKSASVLEKGSTKTVFAKDASCQAEGYTISVRANGIYVGYGDQEAWLSAGYEPGQDPASGRVETVCRHSGWAEIQ